MATPTGAEMAAAIKRADEWREMEIAKARKRLAKGDDVEAVLESLSRGLTQKMLHGTMKELQSTELSRQVQAAETVQRLFLNKQR